MCDDGIEVTIAPSTVIYFPGLKGGEGLGRVLAHESPHPLAFRWIGGVGTPVWKVSALGSHSIDSSLWGGG